MEATKTTLRSYKAIKINGIKHDYHRLVAEAKLGRKLEETEAVHHIDGNKHNNDPANLEIHSVSEHGRLHSRQTLNGAKLLPEDVPTIRQLIAQGMNRRSIAALYGVQPKAISNIKTGRTWSWL